MGLCFIPILGSFVVRNNRLGYISVCVLAHPKSCTFLFLRHRKSYALPTPSIVWNFYLSIFLSQMLQIWILKINLSCNQKYTSWTWHWENYSHLLIFLQTRIYVHIDTIESWYRDLCSLVVACANYLTWTSLYEPHLWLVFFVKHKLDIKERNILMHLSLYQSTA